MRLVDSVSPVMDRRPENSLISEWEKEIPARWRAPLGAVPAINEEPWQRAEREQEAFYRGGP